MKRKFYLLLFLGFVFFVSYNDVFACRCVYVENPSPEFVVSQRAKAIAVFSGEVIESDIEKVKFKIEKVWKGDIGSELQMSTGGKKIDKDLYQLPSSCDFDFYKAEKYLVFAFGNDLDNMKATKCNLTNQLKKAEMTEKILEDFFGAEKEKQKLDVIFSAPFSIHNLLAEISSFPVKSSFGLTK